MLHGNSGPLVQAGPARSSLLTGTAFRTPWPAATTAIATAVAAIAIALRFLIVIRSAEN
jgi:hypothetical protein